MNLPGIQFGNITKQDLNRITAGTKILDKYTNTTYIATSPPRLIPPEVPNNKSKYSIAAREAQTKQPHAIEIVHHHLTDRIRHIQADTDPRFDILG